MAEASEKVESPMAEQPQLKSDDDVVLTDQVQKPLVLRPSQEHIAKEEAQA